MSYKNINTFILWSMTDISIEFFLDSYIPILLIYSSINVKQLVYALDIRYHFVPYFPAFLSKHKSSKEFLLQLFIFKYKKEIKCLIVGF